MFEINDKIKELNAQVAALNEKRQTIFREEFGKVTDAFFKEFPETQAIVFSGYIPYFNDGDPCVYSVSTPIFVRKNFDTEDLQNPYEYEDDEEYDSVSFWSHDETRAQNDFELACIRMTKLIEGNDDLIEMMFGEHAAIYITPEETIANEYYHD